MGLGVFLPIFRAPIVGPVNFFMNGNADGKIVLALAVGAALCILFKAYMVPLLASVAAGAILWFDVSNFTSKMSSVRDSMEAELAGNPFAGLAQAMVQSVQIEVGAYVIGLGAVVLFIGSVWGNAVHSKAQ